MNLKSVRKLFGFARTSQVPVTRRHRARPSLESLEDRRTPATLHVGSSPSEFHTIQSAVLAANPGDTVQIDPGVYKEQVTIDRNSRGVVLNNLDLEGANQKSIITLPAPGTTTTAIVEINEAHNVTVNKLTIQGPGGGPGSIGYGIEVDAGASAVITNDHITHIRDNPLSGDQNGVGIRVGRVSKGSAIIANDTIDDYQKGGIVVDNVGSAAVIDHNVITGSGPTNLIAQNGIQISDGAQAVVTRNTISSNSYIPGDYDGIGILLFGSGSAYVSNNVLTSNDAGIYVFGSSSTIDIEQNQISASTFDGIDLDGVSNVNVSKNQIAQSGVNGISLTDHSTGNDIEQNRSRNNGQDGIYVEAGSTGNTFDQNQLQHNRKFDAEDLTTGTGTAGTGNTWTHNHGKTSNPPGLFTDSGND